MLSTAANAGLGLVFWIAAARLYPAPVLGAGAGGISALQLAGAIGWLGLQFTLMRYAPIAGKQRRRLIGTVYTVGSTAGALTAVVFLLVLARSLRLEYLTASFLSGLVFCAGVATWVMFSLQDAALVGIRRAGLVPIENAGYGVVKLAALVALATLARPWTILGVWMGGATLLTAIVSVLLFGSLLRNDDETARLPRMAMIAKFSVGHTAVALTAWVPDLLVPLLVLRYAGESANAHYYAAWTIGFSARLLAANMANALTVEASYGEISTSELLRSIVRLSVVVITPVILVLEIGAGFVLRIFGHGYAITAAPLLRYFALSLIPSTVVAFVVAVERVHERFGAALLITAFATVSTLALDLIILPRLGITGAGIAWLIGQAGAAVLALATFDWTRRTRFGPSTAVEGFGETPTV